MSEPSPKLPPEDRLSKEQEMWANAVGAVRRRVRGTRIMLLLVVAATAYQITGGVALRDDMPWWLRVLLLSINLVAVATVSFLYGRGTQLLEQMEHSVVMPRLWQDEVDE